jgi:GNAT superfamily N-acetyltransferase
MIERCTNLRDIADVVNDGARAYRGVIPDDRWHEPYMPDEELAREIAAGVAFWGFYEGSRLLGVMGLQPVADVALVRHAYTRTEAQGRGIGSALLKELVSLNGATPLLVGTWKAATWAIRFYERRGFRLVGEEEKIRLLRRYWTVPDRQIEESVVLRN